MPLTQCKSCESRSQWSCLNRQQYWSSGWNRLTTDPTLLWYCWWYDDRDMSFLLFASVVLVAKVSDLHNQHFLDCWWANFISCSLCSSCLTHMTNTDVCLSSCFITKRLNEFCYNLISDSPVQQSLISVYYIAYCKTNLTNLSKIVHCRKSTIGL